MIFNEVLYEKVDSSVRYCTYTRLQAGRQAGKYLPRFEYRITR